MPEDMKMPRWTMPEDLATLVSDDGEWEDPSFDPLLLTVIGDTRFEGRLIPLAWQLSLWPSDVFFKDLAPGLRAQGIVPDGSGWSDVLHQAVASRDAALAERLHDDSDAATCVLWVETEADGKALMEIAWRFVHELKDDEASR